MWRKKRVPSVKRPLVVSTSLVVTTYKKSCVLSQICYVGICHTVSSFIELIPFFLKIPGVCGFLSDTINQDPLEKYFGIQRQAGKSNENPTVSIFLEHWDN